MIAGCSASAPTPTCGSTTCCICRRRRRWSTWWRSRAVAGPSSSSTVSSKTTSASTTSRAAPTRAGRTTSCSPPSRSPSSRSNARNTPTPRVRRCQWCAAGYEKSSACSPSSTIVGCSACSTASVATRRYEGDKVVLNTCVWASGVGPSCMGGAFQDDLEWAPAVTSRGLERGGRRQAARIERLCSGKCEMAIESRLSS